MSIPSGTYRIESVNYPGRVLDLRGSNPDPGTPIICFTNEGNDNQKWFVQLLFDGGDIYGFRAKSPSSNLFSENPNPGASISGDPVQKTELQLRQTGTRDVFQITTNLGGPTLALEAPASQTEAVTFQVLDTSSRAQQWNFTYLNE